MKTFMLSLVALAFLAGCETKVINHEPPAKGPVIVEHEHDRPVIIEKQPAQKPDVEVHIDR